MANRETEGKEHLKIKGGKCLISSNLVLPSGNDRRNVINQKSLVDRECKIKIKYSNAIKVRSQRYCKKSHLLEC